jgi:hypothetical protein
MPKSAPREDLFSVEETADKLQVRERTVWNLIKNGKLVTEEIDGRVWISSVEINRYRLIYKDTHSDHVFSRFPSTAASSFQKYVVFGPSGGDYPQFDLEVTLDDWMRLVAKPVTEQAEYEKIRTEVRRRLGPNAPEYFAVRFHINQTDLAQILNGAVHRVEIPERLNDYYNGDEDVVRSMAMEHLLDHTLLRIDGVRGDPYDYLIRSVKNFYIDWVRWLKRTEYLKITFGGPDEVEVRHITATHRLSGRKRRKKPTD